MSDMQMLAGIDRMEATLDRRGQDMGLGHSSVTL